MIGVLNTTCEWCKKAEVNKYGETTYSTPITLPCAVGKEVKLKQTDIGLVSSDEQYYILHFGEVQNGDTIDGYTVAVSEIKDLLGKTAYYKAVVLNG